MEDFEADLSPPEWQQVKEVFYAALDLSQQDRVGLLAGCDSPRVRREVAQMLAARESGGGIVRTGIMSLHRAIEYHEAGLRNFWPGDVAGDRYEIRAFLGEGGMGEVYEAFDRELNLSVALKTLRPALSRNPELVGRFKQEISLARKVTHPNVCRVFDLDWHTTDGVRSTAFLTMQLLRGEVLHASIRRQGRLRRKEALAIAQQVAEGLDAAHEAGIIHRDLKSSNVMILENGHAVITDFGLALDTAMAVPAGDSAGTPAYIAPEQLQGRAITAAADIYAFGTLLFEMVAGRVPFDNPDAEVMARARLERDAPRLGQVVTAERDWDAAIAACLERDPAKRPVRATAVTNRMRHGKWTRRAWIGAAAAAGAGIGYWEIEKPKTFSAEAMKHFQRAEDLAKNRSEKRDMDNAIEEYRAAIQIEPDFAEAWAGIGEVYATMSNFGYSSSRPSLETAIGAARRAVQIDPRCTRAVGLIGYCRSIDVHHWLTAGKIFEQALAIDPKDWRTLHFYGSFLGKLGGREADAIAFQKKSLALNPSSTVVVHQLAQQYFLARRIDEFYQQAQDFVKLAPHDATSHHVMARAHAEKQEWDLALASCDTAAIYGRPSTTLCIRGYVEAARGNRAEAKRILGLVEEAYRAGPLETMLVVPIYCRLGDKTRAIEFLNNGFAREDSTVLTARVHPYLEPIRKEQGYLAFLRLLGFVV